MEVTVLTGDITTRDVDAVVNAANSSLLGGGGVDGAIHAAAGPRLLQACRALRATLPAGLPTGQAVATEGFDLPARWVIHTVGPNLHAGEDDPALLEACFSNSLGVAEDLGAASLAFPAVSAGIYGWPAETVARIAFDVVGRHRGGLELVEFVLFSPGMTKVFESAWKAQSG